MQVSSGGGEIVVPGGAWSETVCVVEGAGGVLAECIQPCSALFVPLLRAIFLNSSAPSTDDTIGDLKKLIAAQTGTRWNKIVLKKW